MDDLWKIGQVAKMTGLTIKAIRHYEIAGVLPHPPRSPGGFRLYGPEVIQRLALIKQTRAMGFSLEESREICELMDAGCCSTVRPEARNLIEEKLRKLDQYIGELKLLRATLRAVAQELSKECDTNSCTPDRCIPAAEMPIILIARTASGNPERFGTKGRGALKG